MIELTTGKNGTGKSLRVVDKLIKRIEKEADLPLEQQTDIYTNLTGLKIENVNELPDSLDWRDTPPGSLVIYDEPQLHEMFKPSRGASRYKSINDLTIHRKTEHEIWFVCPHPKMLHSDILDLVHVHEHLVRPYGAKLATVYRWNEVKRNPRSRTSRDDAVESVFKYPKNIYKYYESAQGHTAHNKIQIPPNLYYYGIAILAIGYFGYTQFASDGTQSYLNSTSTTVESSDAKTTTEPAEPKKTEDTKADPTTEDKSFLEQSKSLLSGDVGMPTSTTTSTNIQSQLQLMELQRVAMVISSETDCIARNSYGHILNIPLEKCLYYSNNPKFIGSSFLPTKIPDHLKTVPSPQPLDEPVSVDASFSKKI